MDKMNIEDIDMQVMGEEAINVETKCTYKNKGIDSSLLFFFLLLVVIIMGEYR